jgi:hypothetical protein
VTEVLGNVGFDSNPAIALLAVLGNYTAFQDRRERNDDSGLDMDQRAVPRW